MRDNIILIGFMGSGKTTVGHLLAKTTGRVFLDTDEEIVKREGRSINEIFSDQGEAYFRDLETEELKTLLDGDDHLVISVGGGLPVREENRALLHQLGTVIFLQAGVEALVGRLAGDTTRPMLHGYDLVKRIRELMDSRMDQYMDAADVLLRTDDMDPETVAQHIVNIVTEGAE